MRILGTAVQLAAALTAFSLALIEPDTVQRWVEVGGPMVIFGLLFACGLGLPLPEDIPLIVGGFFVAKGKMNIVVVSVLAWCGIIGGDCVLYHMGKKYGLNITRVPFVGKHLTKERILKAERLFEKYGIWVVAVGRLVAGIRGAMVVAAGTIRFNFIKFVIADGIAALISGGLFVWLGYFLGKQFGSVGQIHQKIEPVMHWVILGLVAGIALLIVYWWWRAKRHKTLAEVAVEKVIESSDTTPKNGPAATDAVAK